MEDFKNENEVTDQVIEINNDCEMDNAEKRNNNKMIIKNIIIVAISNLLSLAAGILVGFVLPKIMAKDNYGYYKTFTLYFSYIGLFHFGFVDGIYLLYAGKKYSELNKEKFRIYTRFLIIFQTIISIIIMAGSIPFLKYELGVIFFCLGINVIFNSMTGYYQIISQVTGRFKELSIRNVIKAFITSVAVLLLTALYYGKVIGFVSYFIYIIIFTSINAALTIWYMYTYKDILFGKTDSLKNEKQNIIYYIKIGFPLLLANLVSGFILTIDRQFVSILFDIEIYASYAFAYNMLALITTVISAISTVLYPTIKIFNDKQLKDNYNRLNSIIAIVVSLSVASYYPLKFIIEIFLENYIDSLPIFRIILPGLIISSCISIIMYNYYKAMNKTMRYFIISVVILALSAGANTIAYLIFKTPLAISIASVIVMVIWYFIVEFTIVKKFKINTIKNILYIALIMAGFYILTYFIDNVFIGFGIYVAFFIALTLTMYFKLIRNKFRRY